MQPFIDLSPYLPLLPRPYVFPIHPIIFPGSFNPAHVGHIALANAACRIMAQKISTWQQERKLFIENRRIMESEGNNHNNNNNNNRNNNQRFLDELWNKVDQHSFKEKGESLTVLFEMSLTNPDKPSMDPKEVARRVSLFHDASTRGAKEKGIINMPNDWGILLTSAPLFIQKVQTFKKYLNSHANESSLLDKEEQYKEFTDINGIMPRMTFVIGTDTMLRIVNPKYYGGRDNMIEAVREMRNEGVHFVVGGRVEQGSDGGKRKRQAKFVSGLEELDDLPHDIQNMFTVMDEDEFRVDISSTELREGKV
mmetsp:Transcript_4375/g.6161  ORF Transcript_4375/g.6161 Transcript_4375/m.6161 type:complete len:309 (+) Transcript_4375:687-1613(+)